MTQLAWTIDDIASDIGGTVVGDGTTVVNCVSTDSRAPMAEGLFVPVVGERFDGHDFIGDAVEAGALAVVAEVGRTQVMPRIEISDVAEALVNIAAKRRAELSMPVVAITGSTGKTSTKDLIAAGIPGSWASPRSYNNEVGVPLTVLATPSDASALILEVGSRGQGNIRWLGRCIQPDVAVVTNLGVVHLETFGSESGLANAKYEIVELLDERGTAVLPNDEPRLHRNPDIPTIYFGTHGDADVLASIVSVDPYGLPEIEVTVGSRTKRVALSMAGDHQAANVATAVATAAALGIERESFIENMAGATGSAWRMEVHRGEVTIVNDAYNANPQSVASALRTVAAMPGRSIAVLGPMAELGSVCETEHRRMGELAADLGFSDVIVVGPDHGYVLGSPELVRNATTFESARDTLRDALEPRDVVLVKGSRSAGLERLAIQLIKDYPT
jgi:UDP-N-acetylmuramoyl-tripeptide--D-alanyl-D-alanine ligase